MISININPSVSILISIHQYLYIIINIKIISFQQHQEVKKYSLVRSWSRSIRLILLLSILSFATSVSYTAIGLSSLTIPNGVSSINVKLWGAGGAGTSAKNNVNGNVDSVYAGGSGAFVSCDMAVTGGTTIYLLVGQGGQVSSYGTNSAAAIGGGGNAHIIIKCIC
jgi:hypothetical protein